MLFYHKENVIPVRRKRWDGEDTGDEILKTTLWKEIRKNQGAYSFLPYLHRCVDNQKAVEQIFRHGKSIQGESSQL